MAAGTLQLIRARNENDYNYPLYTLHYKDEEDKKRKVEALKCLAEDNVSKDVKYVEGDKKRMGKKWKGKEINYVIAEVVELEIGATSTVTDYNANSWGDNPPEED